MAHPEDIVEVKDGQVVCWAFAGWRRARVQHVAAVTARVFVWNAGNRRATQNVAHQCFAVWPAPAQHRLRSIRSQLPCTTS
jgi:hypothetical protein